MRETVNFAVQVPWPQDKVNCSWNAPVSLHWLQGGYGWLEEMYCVHWVRWFPPLVSIHLAIHRWELLQYAIFQSLLNEQWSLHGSLNHQHKWCTLAGVFNPFWFLKDHRVTWGLLCYSSTTTLVIARKDQCINWRFLHTFALGTMTLCYTDI